MYVPKISYIKITRSYREIRRLKRADILSSAVRLFTVLLFVTSLIAVMGKCFQPWIVLKEMERKRNGLAAELEVAEQRKEQARLEWSWATNDPEYIEMLARDINNMAMPHETVYRILPYKPKPKPEEAEIAGFFFGMKFKLGKNG